MAISLHFSDPAALGRAIKGWTGKWRWVLFQTHIIGTRIIGFQYDVSADGRFLMNSLPSGASPLTLMTGWTGLLMH